VDKRYDDAGSVREWQNMLFLGYCTVKGIAGGQFQSTNIYSEGLKTGSIDRLLSFTKLVQNEIANS
jgi:hypothetical protein